MYFEQPSITIFNIIIDEPVTTLTDLVVSTVCFYAFFKLRAIAERTKLHYYLKIYFASMGVATFFGGVVGHGFLRYFDQLTNFDFPVSPWKLLGWYTSMISIAMLERAVIERSRVLIPKKVGWFFSRLNILELLTFMTITGFSLNFFFVEVHSAYGLLVITSSFSLLIYLKTRHVGSLRFLIAVGISAVSALVFMNQWGIGKWFNHYDISHTLMAFGAWFFYRGATYMITHPIDAEGNW